MSDLKAYIANCLVGGDTISRNGGVTARDTIEFDCSGHRLVLWQRPEVISKGPEKFKGRFCETSEIIVRNVQQDAVPDALATIDRVCWLLSFAGLSKTMRYGYDYPDGNPTQHRETVAGVADFFRPTIEIRDGKAVKSFIEQTYGNYVRLETSRKLNVVIDYMLQAERKGLPTECKLIFAFVLFENLKDTFGRSKSIPFVDGFFRVAATPKSKTISFKKMLIMMLDEVGMTKELQGVVDLRNEIVHSGLSRMPHSELWKAYEEIHDLFREYLLRLLGFQGHYLLYTGAGSVSASI